MDFDSYERYLDFETGVLHINSSRIYLAERFGLGSYFGRKKPNVAIWVLFAKARCPFLKQLENSFDDDWGNGDGGVKRVSGVESVGGDWAWRSKPIRGCRFMADSRLSIHRVTDSSIHRFIDLSIYRCIDSSIYRCIGTSIHRSYHLCHLRVYFFVSFNFLCLFVWL